MKTLKYALTILSFSLFMAGCQQDSTTSTAAPAQTVTVEDDRGETEVPLDPEKVVVYDFGHLDTMLDLGLEDQIVGTVTENVPAYLEESTGGYESVGTLKEPDMEALAASDPDLIIISNRLADFAEDMEEIAPVLVLGIDYTSYWETVERNISVIGQVFDVETQAAEALAALEEKTAALRSRVEQLDQKALAVILNNGEMSAFSTGSRFSFIFDTLGFKPVDTAIETSTHGQSVGYEGLLEINPDILFVVDRSAAIEENGTDNNSLLENEFIYQTSAYQNDRIIYLSPDIWYLSGGGLQSLELMVEEIGQSF